MQCSFSQIWQVTDEDEERDFHFHLEVAISFLWFTIAWVNWAEAIWFCFECNCSTWLSWISWGIDLLWWLNVGWPWIEWPQLITNNLRIWDCIICQRQPFCDSSQANTLGDQLTTTWIHPNITQFFSRHSWYIRFSLLSTSSSGMTCFLETIFDTWWIHIFSSSIWACQNG